MERFDEILELADGIMVARGDLGVEIPPEQVPSIQKRIVRAAREAGKPVVVATQMLDSMIRAPEPTRAEASDVATAVYDGGDAVMLSAETAAGAWPVEAVDMMRRIVERVEADPYHARMLEAAHTAPAPTAADALSAAARQVAHTIGAAAIVTYTQSGATALRASRERPDIPILCLTPVWAMARRLALAWGVRCVHGDDARDFHDMVARACRASVLRGYAAEGDRLVIVAGCPSAHRARRTCCTSPTSPASPTSRHRRRRKPEFTGARKATPRGARRRLFPAFARARGGSCHRRRAIRSSRGDDRRAGGPAAGNRDIQPPAVAEKRRPAGVSRPRRLSPCVVHVERLTAGAVGRNAFTSLDAQTAREKGRRCRAATIAAARQQDKRLGQRRLARTIEAGEQVDTGQRVDIEIAENAKNSVSARSSASLRACIRFRSPMHRRALHRPALARARHSASVSTVSPRLLRLLQLRTGIGAATM